MVEDCGDGGGQLCLPEGVAAGERWSAADVGQAGGRMLARLAGGGWLV